MLPERSDAPRSNGQEQQLAHALALIDELRHQRAQLEAQIESLRLQLDRAQLACAELQRLLGSAQQQLGELMRATLPASAEPGRRAVGRAEHHTTAFGTVEPATTTHPSAWQRWREQRSGLGASLTVTGLVAGVAGVLLHLALRTQVIDTAVHLGYAIGLTGLLLFLIGLLIVL